MRCTSCGSTEIDLYVCPICGKVHRAKCRKCGFEMPVREMIAG